MSVSACLRSFPGFWDWLEVNYQTNPRENCSCCEAFFVQFLKSSLLLSTDRFLMSEYFDPVRDQELYPCSVLKSASVNSSSVIMSSIRAGFCQGSVQPLCRTAFLSSRLFLTALLDESVGVVLSPFSLFCLQHCSAGHL